MKCFTVIIFIMFSAESFAQFTKGDIVLGGEFSLFMSWEGETVSAGRGLTRYFSFGLHPYFGILLKSNLEIGGLIGFTESYSKDRSSSRPSGSRYFTTGLYMHRYFVISEKFLFTLQGDAEYLIRKSTNNLDSMRWEEIREDILKLKITPKFIFFPSPKWGIHAGLDNIHYTYSKKALSTTAPHSFDITFGMIILGVFYYFRH